MRRALPLLMLFLGALPASAQLAFVQSKACDFNFTDPNGCAFDSNVAAGNLIVAAYVDHSNRNVQSVTDSLGNTYTQVYNKLCNGTNPCVHLYYTISGSSGANTVTFDFNNTTLGHIVMMEFSGAASASALDRTASAGTGNNNAPVSGTTGTTVQANELVIGLLGLQAAAAITKGASFTVQVKPGDERASMEYKVVGSTGTYNANWSLSASRVWVAVVATFKEAAAAGASARRRVVVVQ